MYRVLRANLDGLHSEYAKAPEPQDNEGPRNGSSPTPRDVFVEELPFFRTEAVQILAYTIPGANGTFEPRRRLLNWVWYVNYAEGGACARMGSSSRTRGENDITALGAATVLYIV